MARTSKPSAPTAPTPIRCAIYTRKSTEEGLEQEFNSLDAQREACESYIKSQQHEGWVLAAERYDDGGYTGGNLERPAVLRLMADIAAGRVQCVVVYKVDRLSRSLLDFARMMQTFETHRVAFVSVTQQFNTATSMGRLVLNVLLSFAQFEREIIAERTRDKKAATARRGQWTGGPPILGYDLDPRGGAIHVNPAEAEQVRAIFGLYLEHGALRPVVEEVNGRGWTNKAWTTRKGTPSGGHPFVKSTVQQLLTNVTYSGRIPYKGESYPGVHEAIVDATTFERVQEKLQANNRIHGARLPNRYGALLMGLLRCGPCGCSMTPSTAAGKNRTYRYYVCSSAQRLGRSTCPAPSLPAGPTERYVLDQITAITDEPDLTPAMHVAVQMLVRGADGPPHLQAQVLRNLVESITYDGDKGTLAIHFHDEPLPTEPSQEITPCRA